MPPAKSTNRPSQSREQMKSRKSKTKATRKIESTRQVAGKILYLDIFSGISGDMFIGALLDLGVDAHELQHELEKLRLEGYHLHISRAHKAAIEGVKFDVHLAHVHNHEHTHTDGVTHTHSHSHEHHDHEHSHAHGHHHHEKEEAHHHQHSD